MIDQSSISSVIFGVMIILFIGLIIPFLFVIDYVRINFGHYISMFFGG